jgi:hypothetical protein
MVQNIVDIAAVFFVRYMRGQGDSFATIARDVRMTFPEEPKRRITGPELQAWYDQEAASRRK